MSLNASPLAAAFPGSDPVQIGLASRSIRASNPDLKTSLQSVIEGRRVSTVFQPILRLSSAEIHGYESLARSPVDGPFRNPSDLFAAAKHSGCLAELELLCCEEGLAEFQRLRLPGKIFLNISPETVVDAHLKQSGALDFLQTSGIDTDRIIIELTEQQKTPGLDDLREALMLFRSLGIRVAIDDLGQGFSSLRLWSELRPELVKIDMHFVQGIHLDPVKFQFLKSIQQIADSCGSKLIAEGIEERADLLVLRDLGIAFGQGFFIARPASPPPIRVEETIVETVRSRGISVFPQASRVPGTQQITAGKLVIRTKPVAPETTNDEVLDRFEEMPDLHAMPVVMRNAPVGLINRNAFIARFVRPYRKEVYGKRSCANFMDLKPLIVDKNLSIHELSETLVGADQRYLSEGFIITENGRYVGIGTGQDLIREITTLQLDTARYANPLTLLPGNVPIEGHVERLLSARSPFVAAYADINHFKPFNDAYGYRRGDEMIKLLARNLVAACDPKHDFVGHIGGDDFILMLQSPDWEDRCQHALNTFAAESTLLFNESDRARGMLVGEDRTGKPVLFPLTTLAIGIVLVEPGLYLSHLHVSAAASEAKKQAKRMGGNSLFVERRRPST